MYRTSSKYRNWENCTVPAWVAVTVWSVGSLTIMGFIFLQENKWGNVVTWSVSPESSILSYDLVLLTLQVMDKTLPLCALLEPVIVLIWFTCELLWLELYCYSRAIRALYCWEVNFIIVLCSSWFLLTHWQVHQFVTSSKVLRSSSVESTRTLFALRLMQTQFTSKR